LDSTNKQLFVLVCWCRKTMMCLRKTSWIRRDRIWRIWLNSFPKRLKIWRLRSDCSNAKAGIFTQWWLPTKGTSLDCRLSSYIVHLYGDWCWN
jgi:hypothetical protein